MKSVALLKKSSDISICIGKKYTFIRKIAAMPELTPGVLLKCSAERLSGLFSGAGLSAAALHPSSAHLPVSVVPVVLSENRVPFMKISGPGGAVYEGAGPV